MGARGRGEAGGEACAVGVLTTKRAWGMPGLVEQGGRHHHVARHTARRRRGDGAHRGLACMQQHATPTPITWPATPGTPPASPLPAPPPGSCAAYLRSSRSAPGRPALGWPCRRAHRVRKHFWACDQPVRLIRTCRTESAELSHEMLTWIGTWDSDRAGSWSAATWDSVTFARHQYMRPKTR